MVDGVAFGHLSGSSSGVERHVANVVVVGSNPISRSIYPCIPGWRLTLERFGCVVADLDPAGRIEARARFPSLEHRVIYNT